MEDLEDPLAAVVGVFSNHVQDGQDDLEATVRLGNSEEAWGWSEKEGLLGEYLDRGENDRSEEGFGRSGAKCGTENTPGLRTEDSRSVADMETG